MFWYGMISSRQMLCNPDIPPSHPFKNAREDINPNLTAPIIHAKYPSIHKGEFPMTSKRSRILISIIAALIIIAILSGVWGTITVRRSFPQVDGTLRLPGLDGEVEVIRDSMGIPHIYASSEHDLFMAQGFVHAQDRFWQMDFWRHVGSGRLAEMFGSSQLETDMFLRTLGWARVAREELELATADELALLENYADGVNAYLAQRQGSALSLEYAVLGLLTPDYAPEDWTPLHTLTWAKAMAWDLGSNMDAEMARARLNQLLGTERAAELFPPYPSDGPVIIPSGQGMITTQADIGHDIASITLDLSSLEAQMAALDSLLGGRGLGIGSNNWVISGTRSSTGAPILANDPHLSIQMPAIWYQIGLHCNPTTEACPYNVMGFSFAGAPGVIIGHNNHIAWGVTNVGPDVQDLFIEKINPDNPLQYEFNGEWVDMTVVEEEILVAGEDPITIEVRYTHHGPILSDVDEDLATLDQITDLDIPAEFAVSLRWTALEPGRVFTAILNLNTAQDFEGFRSALTDFVVPSQNFIYGDVAGNIGYQMPGRIPIRAGGDGSLPVPGWVDDYEWTGYIPFDELPYAYNPSQGYIITANHAVVGPDYPYLITTMWDYGYRGERIIELVEEQATLSPEDMRTIQGDNYHAMGPLLVPLLGQLTFDDPELTNMVTFLQGWDYQCDLDSAEAALFNAFWRNLLLTIFADELDLDDIPSSSRALAIVEYLLADVDNAWWDDVQTAETEILDDALRGAFATAVAEMQETFGSNIDRWSWGALHGSTFRNATLGESGIAPIEALFNRGPFPTAGGSSIVNATSWSETDGYQVGWLPSMRMIIDLSDLDNSVAINTTGQSGHAYHPHYIDMADLWRMIQYHPLPWSRGDVEAESVSVLTLVP
jgi:penicillin amidase